MRRQTLALLPVLCVALGLAGFSWFMTTRAASPSGWRTETAQGLTFQVPEGSRGPYHSPGTPWSATEFPGSLGGTLRIAQESPQGDLDQALQNWFELPGPLDRPRTYALHGQPAQARPVTAFGPAGHFLARRGRQLQAVLVFDLDGSRYWIQLRTGNPSAATLAGFHRMLLSLRGPQGEAPDSGLARELAAAGAEPAPGLLERHPWPPQMGFLFPAALMLLAGAAQIGLGRLAGRAPRGPGALANRYLEAPIEVCLARRLQRKWFDAALSVTDDRLVIHTFGTPLLSVPLAALAGKVTPRTGWFGSSWLELGLEGGQEFHKHRFFYGGLAGKLRLRLYTRDEARLRAALRA